LGYFQWLWRMPSQAKVGPAMAMMEVAILLLAIAIAPRRQAHLAVITPPSGPRVEKQRNIASVPTGFRKLGSTIMATLCTTANTIPMKATRTKIEPRRPARLFFSPARSRLRQTFAVRRVPLRGITQTGLSKIHAVSTTTVERWYHSFAAYRVS
jgi:hypothetical protein